MLHISPEMNARAAEFSYPQPHRKILHLVRHGQAVHNVEGDKNREALLSGHLFDAKLTPLGLQQVDELRKGVHDSGLLNRVELVITSPLSRAMETAVGVFGIGGHSSPPIMAVELCRDRLGVRPCDKRRKISDCQSRFPSIDFSLMDEEDDNLWKPDIREPEEELAERVAKFLKWLWIRPEKEIVVVSHGLVLQQIVIRSRFGNDCNNLSGTKRAALCKWFGHCELRSAVVVDERITSLYGFDHQEDEITARKLLPTKWPSLRIDHVFGRCVAGGSTFKDSSIKVVFLFLLFQGFSISLLTSRLYLRRHAC